ncbi:hypothetical protein [Niallia circulans]|uniref:hypothetical protein n=1 Tax=Niallia circulans TaxID=1397 RepID=UPI0026EDB97B|nr:hypothetical protein [Niallia circulans]
MIKVIETNLSVNFATNEIVDHQSRVVEVSSWEDLIMEIQSGKTVIRNSVIGSLHGNTIPKESKVENLIFDEKHLSCDITIYDGSKTKKLIYKV